jgi:hypothetical protein
MKNFRVVVERLPRVHLYPDPSTKTLNLLEIADYLKNKFGGKISVDVRKPLIVANSPRAEVLARKLAETKVRDVMNPNVYLKPLPGEIEFERRLLENPSLKLSGILYDGFQLQRVARELLPSEELNFDHAHIVFTNRLFATFEATDRRYHARVSIYGFPSLISTTGIVEAPAKPKEFYELKRRYAALGETQLEELKERFRGRYIDYDDDRLTEVMKGYVMQALFYHLTLDPFCSDKRCRLYNAHWQEEVLEAQLGEPEFCERHAKMLERFVESLQE